VVDKSLSKGGDEGRENRHMGISAKQEAMWMGRFTSPFLLYSFNLIFFQ